ncbi:MAG: hypothetical protein Q9183_002712 [Haloplaca sp. 2 TL-2023]
MVNYKCKLPSKKGKKDNDDKYDEMAEGLKENFPDQFRNTNISAYSLEKRLWCLDEMEVDYFRQGMKDFVKALQEKGQEVPEGLTISEYDAMERKGDLGAQRLREEMAANLDALCKNAPMKVSLSSWNMEPIEAPVHLADQAYDEYQVGQTKPEVPFNPTISQPEYDFSKLPPLAPFQTAPAKKPRTRPQRTLSGSIRMVEFVSDDEGDNAGHTGNTGGTETGGTQTGPPENPNLFVYPVGSDLCTIPAYVGDYDPTKRYSSSLMRDTFTTFHEPPAEGAGPSGKRLSRSVSGARMSSRGSENIRPETSGSKATGLRPAGSTSSRAGNNIPLSTSFSRMRISEDEDDTTPEGGHSDAAKAATSTMSGVSSTIGQPGSSYGPLSGESSTAAAKRSASSDRRNARSPPVHDAWNTSYGSPRTPGRVRSPVTMGLGIRRADDGNIMGAAGPAPKETQHEEDEILPVSSSRRDV